MIVLVVGEDGDGNGAVFGTGVGWGGAAGAEHPLLATRSNASMRRAPVGERQRCAYGMVVHNGRPRPSARQLATGTQRSQRLDYNCTTLAR